MGTVYDSQDNKVQLEYFMTLVPPSLKFTVYLMDKFTSYALNSERFDFKSRASEEDLESRRDWQSAQMVTLLGDVFILEPIERRGKMLEISVRFSWDPCFAIIRWQMGSCYSHVAVRPSPPYRTWVKDNLAPVTWFAAVNHADKTLDNLRTHRMKPHEPSSSSTALTQAVSPVIRQPPAREMTDGFCQADFETADNFAQTIGIHTTDFGVGPDLTHLETDITIFRSVDFYHPPWPVVWITVIDSFGVIHDTLWSMPTPTEFEIPLNQFPPETTHEIVILPAYGLTTDMSIPVAPRRPFWRMPPPPPPTFPRPEPPAERPGHMPIPRDIRFVYTHGAALLRSQPEMHHPRRPIAPLIRDRAAQLGNFDIAAIARYWSRLLHEDPEINPSI